MPGNRQQRSAISHYCELARKFIPEFVKSKIYHMAIKIQKKDDYIDLLETKRIPKCRPINGQINLTFRCNLRCRHCNIVHEKDKRELKFKEVISIIDQIYASGCIWLCFSGGEVFLKGDFLDIYAYAKKKCFLVTIFTNGTLITREIADILAKNPPYSIEITINGITKDTYEAVTQTEGSFQQAIKTIKLLKERNLPLGLKSNGMNLNRDEILKIKQFSEQLLGKGHFSCDLVLYAGMDGSKRPCGLRLAPDEILNIQYSDQDMLSVCEKQFIHPENNLRLQQGYLFPCGLSSFQIDPYGRMQLCASIKEPFVDMKKDPFLDGFIRLYSYFRGLKAKSNTRCRRCGIRYLCRQCPGRAIVENGNMESPVKFFCGLAHKQALARQRLLNKGQYLF